jgi:hypothetical protein
MHLPSAVSLCWVKAWHAYASGNFMPAMIQLSSFLHLHTMQIKADVNKRR